MNKILRTFLAALMLAICGGSIVRAGPFEDGVAAYERGDYREAVKWYRLAAEQGNVNAQMLLGITYEEGQGVAQDYREAVKWYRLAANQLQINYDEAQRYNRAS